MEEIKRVQRSAEWGLVLHLYSTLCKNLAIVQRIAPDGSPIEAAIAELRDIEASIERALKSNRATQLDHARLNRIVSKQMDELGRVLAATIQKAGA